MIKRWDVVVIGHPSRNPYWGESPDRRYRAPVCTCTLVTGEGWRLLVDPAYGDAERMAFELNRRSGLRARDVDQVFVTHGHGDHTVGLSCFPDAEWLPGRQTASLINASGRFGKPLRAASGWLPADVEPLPLPGHTDDLTGLRFMCDGLAVVIAGDATVTADFCLDGLSSFGEQTEQKKASVQKIRQVAEAVVPGHDNWLRLP